MLVSPGWSTLGGKGLSEPFFFCAALFLRYSILLASFLVNLLVSKNCWSTGLSKISTLAISAKGFVAIVLEGILRISPATGANGLMILLNFNI